MMKSKYISFGILVLAIIMVIFISGCVQEQSSKEIKLDIEASKSDVLTFTYDCSVSGLTITCRGEIQNIANSPIGCGYSESGPFNFYDGGTFYMLVGYESVTGPKFVREFSNIEILCKDKQELQPLDKGAKIVYQLSCTLPSYREDILIRLFHTCVEIKE